MTKVIFDISMSLDGFVKASTATRSSRWATAASTSKWSSARMSET